MSGAALMLWIGGVHLVGLICVALLLFPALRDGPVRSDRRTDDGEDGWGRRGPERPPTPPAPPRGGIPLPDAEPARVRLRDHERLGDRLPRRQRRPAREPARRPVRTPHRVGSTPHRVANAPQTARAHALRSGWGSRRRSRFAG